MAQLRGGKDPVPLTDGWDTPAADRERFMAWVTEHLPAVLGVATAIVGPLDAEDAAQEAVLRGWQSWVTLRDREAARSWLLRITVNLCRDWLRGRFGTRARLTGTLDGDEGMAPLRLSPGTSDHTGSLDLRQAVNSLEMELRLVVALRYYAGMDATEIGAALHLPPATVRTRLRRALAILRDRLSETTSHPASQLEQGGR